MIGKTKSHCQLSKIRHCSYICNQGFGNTSLGTRKKKYSLNNRISYVDIYLIVKFRKMITILLRLCGEESMIAVEFPQSFALKSFKSFPKLHDYGLHNTCSHTKGHFI